MTWGPHYHVGYVVVDLEAAMDTVGAALDLRWTDVSDRSRTVQTGAGEVEIRFRTVYSVEGPPHVELIEQVPGTPWSGEPSGLHHVGHWSDDVRHDSGRLGDAGFPLAARAETEPGTWRWAYHRHPAGGYLELVDRSVEAELRARMGATAESPPAAE